MKPIKIIITGLFLDFLAFTTNPASAQKLPNVQNSNLRAPLAIKIDGKTEEWANKFQAYNKATQIFYTIANDADNLYLVVRISDNAIIRKAVTGGITLTVSSPDKKANKHAVGITFPKYNKLDPPLYMTFSYRAPLTKDTLWNKEQCDSVKKAYNLKLSGRAKMIGVIGITAITDSLISIYNDENIKAAFSFDEKLTYSYELAVPLKYLGLKTNNTTKFHYQIQLNGIAVDGTNVRTLAGRDKYIYTRADGTDVELGNGSQVFDLISSTNFEGNYTIAK